MTTVIVPFDVDITWSDIGKFDEGNISEDMFRHISKFQKGLIHLETPPSTANSLHLRKSLFYIFPGSNLTLNTNI